MSVYVAVTEPGCERKAVERLLGRKEQRKLSDREFAVYLPMTRFWRKACGRRVPYAQPIFPGYVFVSTDDISRDYNLVRHARYISHVLDDIDDQPVAIDAGWLEALLILQSFGAFDRTLERRSDIRIGDLVRILGGAFTGQLATVTKLMGKDGQPATKVKVDVVRDGVHKRIDLAVKKLEAAS